MSDNRKTKSQLLGELDVLRRRVAELEARPAQPQLNTPTVREPQETSSRVTEEPFRRAFDDAPIGMALVGLDGRWVEVNRALTHLTGYTKAELRAMNFRQITHPDDIEPDLQKARRLLKGEVDSYDLEKRYLRKDGHEIHASLTVSLLRKADQKPWYVIAQVQDLTERRRAEVWLTSLIETTQDAVISIDRRGHMHHFNPAAERMFGYSRAEALGKEVSLLMPEPYRSEHDGYIAHYEHTGQPRAIGRIRMVTAQRKTGELFPIELSVTELKMDKEVRYGAFIRDISEKVRLQEQLVERERLAAVGTVAAKLAHEIGNPLNSLSMNVQLLERRLAKSDGVRDARTSGYIRDIQGEIGRLTSLLQDFRAMSRRQRLNFQPVVLGSLVDELVGLESAEYAARGVTVATSIAPTLPAVNADAHKLKQMLLNLCKNAAEAMPGGGTLTVRARAGAGKIHIDVTDTGVGIPAGVNIFAPFVTTKAEGTGLGLSIVQQLVFAHGGDISYTSTPGQGTTFTVTLPVERESGRDPS